MVVKESKDLSSRLHYHNRVLNNASHPSRGLTFSTSKKNSVQSAAHTHACARTHTRTNKCFPPVSFIPSANILKDVAQLNKCFVLGFFFCLIKYQIKGQYSNYRGRVFLGVLFLCSLSPNSFNLSSERMCGYAREMAKSVFTCRHDICVSHLIKLQEQVNNIGIREQHGASH